MGAPQAYGLRLRLHYTAFADQLMIPKSYKLLGHTVTVHVVPEEDWKHQDCVGLYEPHRHRILIRGDLTDSLKLHTLYHEMVHSWLTALGHELNDDEKFVDMLGGMMHQAMTTAKFK